MILWPRRLVRWRTWGGSELNEFVSLLVIDTWIILEHSTSLKKHDGRTTQWRPETRKDGGMELQETLMSGVETVMCSYNIWSEPPVQTCVLYGSPNPIWTSQWTKLPCRRCHHESENAILSGDFDVFLWRLMLIVFFIPPINPVCARILDPSVLAFSLS